MFSLREIKSGKLLQVRASGYGDDDGCVDMEYTLETYDGGSLFVAPTATAALLPVMCRIGQRGHISASSPAFPLCDHKPDEVEVVELSFGEPVSVESMEFPTSYFKASDVYTDGCHATDLVGEEEAEPSRVPFGWKFQRRIGFAVRFKKSKVSQEDQLKILEQDYLGKFLYFDSYGDFTGFLIEEVRAPKGKMYAGYAVLVASAFTVAR